VFEMTTFDLSQVRTFTAGLGARMDRCDHGEGMECANLDETLMHYAKICCEFREAVRKWGRAVFAGRVAFDSEVERVWLDEGYRLYARAMKVFDQGRKAEEECYILDGRAGLGSALFDLYRLFTPWITPRLSAGPGPRNAFPVAQGEEADGVRQRLQQLPPLPTNWGPADADQRRMFAQARRRTT
jgi:hypothetical protein